MKAGGIKILTPSSMKAGPDAGLAEGEAKAMVSVYDVFDSDGDRVKSGEWDAFVETFAAGDTVLPVLFAHQHRDPMMYVGEVRGFDPRAKNEKGQSGLAADVTYDLDGDNPNATQAYKLAKGRRVNQWSYHWFGEREPAKDKAGGFDLKALGMTEASMVLRGANGETSTLDIKGEKASGTFGDIEGLLNPDTLQAIGELSPEGRASLATTIASAIRWGDVKAAADAIDQAAKAAGVEADNGKTREFVELAGVDSVLIAVESERLLAR